MNRLVNKRWQIIALCAAIGLSGGCGSLAKVKVSLDSANKGVLYTSGSTLYTEVYNRPEVGEKPMGPGYTATYEAMAPAIAEALKGTWPKIEWTMMVPGPDLRLVSDGKEFLKKKASEGFGSVVEFSFSVWVLSKENRKCDLTLSGRLHFFSQGSWLANADRVGVTEEVECRDAHSTELNDAKKKLLKKFETEMLKDLKEKVIPEIKAAG